MVAVISNMYIYTHLLSPFAWLPYCCFCYSAVCERASCNLASCVSVCVYVCAACVYLCMSATMCMTQNRILCVIVLSFPVMLTLLRLHFYHFTIRHFDRQLCEWLYLPSAPNIVLFLCTIFVGNVVFIFESHYFVCLHLWNRWEWFSVVFLSHSRCCINLCECVNVYVCQLLLYKMQT